MHIVLTTLKILIFLKLLILTVMAVVLLRPFASKWRVFADA